MTTIFPMMESRRRLGKEITIQNGEGLCVAASGTKNGKRIIAQKCKDGSSTQQWQIGPM